MKKKKIISSGGALVALIAITAISVGFSQDALAFRGGNENSMHGGNKNGNSLISEEMREGFREDQKNMTDEEKEEWRNQREERREERRAEMENFAGLSHEEIREAKQGGESMGDILESQGKTQEDAETFLTEKTNERVDHIVENHELDENNEQTLRDRIGEFVGSIIGRWFGN